MGISALLQGNPLKLSLLFMLVSGVLMMVVKDIKQLLSKDKKKTIIYALILLVVFALIGLLSSSKVLNNTPLNSFIAFQVLFLIIGGVHVWVMRKFFDSLSEDKSQLFNEIAFTVALLMIGLITFFCIVHNFKPSLQFIYLASSLSFIVPILFYKLYEFALFIPVKIFEHWTYPTGTVTDPSSDELRNPLVISFEFKKTEDTDDVTNFRVKAPGNLEFGKLFYFFLGDYNEINPESKVEFLDKDDQTYKWMFYKKPSFFKSTMYINSEKTTNNNNLKEDDVIICERI